MSISRTDPFPGFIQVAGGGSLFFPFPLVDDGTHGPRSDPPNCPPLFPSSAGNVFQDTPQNGSGGTWGLNGLKMEVCVVSLQPCCGNFVNRFGNHPYQGYSIVKIGPCRSYTIPGTGNKQGLDNPPVLKSDSPSPLFSQTLGNSYPSAPGGGCISCKNLN